MKEKITLLVDYKGEYFPTHRGTSRGTDLDRLSLRFAERGYTLDVRGFAEVDFRSESFEGRHVIYQSAQDPGLDYKGYIEDVLLGMKLQGAHLIPEFHLFRAHHNKVFMEILRDLSASEEVRSLRSRCYGSYEDFVSDIDSITFPAVLKPASGDSARGVALLRNRVEAKLRVRQLTRMLVPREVWKNVYRKAFMKGWRMDSFHRQKFVVQEFVPGLDHDWKVLVFGPRYFVRVRPTRRGDFRASGVKGERSFPRDLPEGLLDFVEKIFGSFGSPHASVDVLHDGARFHLGEIQFVRFGTGPLLHSPHHFRRSKDGWERVEGTTEWEEALAECVTGYVEEDSRRPRPR
jgi:glutathione synthase/RimK-type ligase-like ATP-grasp enzyme